MRYAAAVAALAGFVAAESWATTNGTAPVYVTEVVTAFTTYCPEATAITHAGETYTVSSATTLTITNCPGGCTITKPVSSSTPVAPVSSSTPAITTSKSSPVAPVGTGASSKAPAGTGKASGTAAGTGSKPSSTGSPITPYTGAGVQVQAGIAGVLAVFGLVAAL